MQRLASALTRWSTRWVPDAWVIAILLSAVTFGLGLILTPSSPLTLVRYWGDGFWELLSFAAQMSLILMTGYILAVTPLFSRWLDALAGVPRNPRQAIALMAFVSLSLAWINWGLSIVGSAVFVRAIVKRQRGVDYRLLVASAYLGLGLLWHSGLSSSTPLLVATPGHFMEAQLGLVPVTQTIFNPFNLGLALVVLVVFTLLPPLLHPPASEVYEADPGLMQDEGFRAPERPAVMTPAVWIEHSRWVNLAVGAAGILWLGLHFADKGLSGVNLNVVNFVFLMLGILLHRTPVAFLKAASDAGQFVWGVLIQFPFYAGIFGIIKFSGLESVLAEAFVRFSTPATFPALVTLYSGVLNYIIPSGGAKWAVEAPYIIEAARQMGVSMPLTVLGYAWGDMLTDIIQPFWAIPLLAVAKLSFRDIMGYGVLFGAVNAVIVLGAFLLAPLFGI